jgi:hypothetical protein
MCQISMYNCKRNLVIFSHVDICFENGARGTYDIVQREKKERNACDNGLNWGSKRVLKRKCWARDRESCILSSGYAWFDVRSTQRLGEFPSVQLLLFCLCLRTPFTPKYPSGGDTVAISGFPRLPLCFTHDRWTAKFGVRGLVTVLSLLLKRWRPRVGSSSFERVKNSSFYSLLLIKYG